MYLFVVFIPTVPVKLQWVWEETHAQSKQYAHVFVDHFSLSIYTDQKEKIKKSDKSKKICLRAHPSLAGVEHKKSLRDVGWIYLFSFIRPQSTTNTQSSIVTEVSAIFVDSTIFLAPRLGFLKTRACSSLDSVEWSGTNTYLPDLEFKIGYMNHQILA